MSPPWKGNASMHASQTEKWLVSYGEILNWHYVGTHHSDCLRALTTNIWFHPLGMQRIGWQEPHIRHSWRSLGPKSLHSAEDVKWMDQRSLSDGVYRITPLLLPSRNCRITSPSPDSFISSNCFLLWCCEAFPDCSMGFTKSTTRIKALKGY